VTMCCEDDPLTFGLETFDFGGNLISLYSETYHAPYRRGAIINRRVISLLVPAPLRGQPDKTPITRQLETL
jgi:hypothetical protein